MGPRSTLTLVDGVKVVVPDSLDLITPYVLIEQQDWFEDEIKFLRHLLEPGQKIIDIGANYGLYTLTMANSVGKSGKVWSFEPASTTASFLVESIEKNSFSHVVLDRCALSNASGSAKLALNEQSEMNSLVRDVSENGSFETVALSTLDECMERYSWTDISFVKIDAEGEESKILKGGQRFFSELSPLIQYEVKAGADVHMELVREFAEIGYESFRLVPGLNCLTPIQVDEKLDSFMLNLFCCKRDQRDRLTALGWIIETNQCDSINDCNLGQVGTSGRETEMRQWLKRIEQKPYVSSFLDRWEKSNIVDLDPALFDALTCYWKSQDVGLPPSVRLNSLERSFIEMSKLTLGGNVSLRYSSLARIATEFGARTIASGALKKLVEHILEGGSLDISEPFLPPTQRFDQIPAVGNIGNWILASVLEAYETVHAFSSFYSGNSSRQRLEFIQKLGVGSPEMERRLTLLKLRFG